YREAALGAADWLLKQGQPADPGTRWPGTPGQPENPPNPESLYSGSPGVVLFFLEASKQTGDPRYLAAARAGADHLAAVLDATEDCGLYSGIAGIGYVLAEAGRRTGEARYTTAARHAVDLLAKRAVTKGDGVEWGSEEAASDIVAGNAGIGLYLLW